jgi:hypothetical protein
MHSTVRVGNPTGDLVHTSANQGLTAEISLVEVAQKSRTAERFRRGIAFAEALIDLLTVGFAVVAGYLAYYNLQLGKHIQYPLKAVFGVAFGFAIVVVLMLDRVGAYNRGNGLCIFAKRNRSYELRYRHF